VNIFDLEIKDLLKNRVEKLEEHFKADVMFFYGAINIFLLRKFRDFIEGLRKCNDEERNKLIVFLNTPGGSAEAVEKIVEII